MKKPLKIPKFKNEDEEFEFWKKIDFSDYFEPTDLKPFNLEQFMEEHADPKSTRITMRVPTELVKKYKAKASKLDVPYQSLMKQQLAKLN